MRCDLAGLNLSEANLEGVDLGAANLADTHFSGARVDADTA